MNETPRDAAGPGDADGVPPVRTDRLLGQLSGRERSPRDGVGNAAGDQPEGDTIIKRTYDLPAAVVRDVRQFALLHGVTANDLVSSLLRDGLEALREGRTQIEIGIVPPEHIEGRAAGRYIARLIHEAATADGPPTPRQGGA